MKQSIAPELVGRFLSGGNHDRRLLYRSKKECLVLLASSLTFVGGGFLAGYDGGEIMWIPVIVFGIFSVVSGLALLPKALFLKIEDDGFRIVQLFRSSFVKWNEVTWFYSGKGIWNEHVLFDYITPGAQPRFMKRISVALCGHSESLLATIYGSSAADLAALLNESKKRHEAGSPISE